MDFNNAAPVLFQNVHLEALLNNSRSITKWTEYKEENEAVQERLKLFLKDLRVPVMIPIGNKAMFRGQLVHTNDILISLGGGYFIKGSAEQAIQISQRRVKKCSEMLKELDKEKKLLESRLTGSLNSAVFASEGQTDINEPYDEKKDEEWRKEHGEKLRKEREAKKGETSNIKDEDLFRRLDYLEMQEELEDELIRLGVDDNSDDESFSEEDYDEGEYISDESEQDTTEQCTTGKSSEHEESSLETPSAPDVKRKSSKVTFAEPLIKSTDEDAEENVSDTDQASSLPPLEVVAISEEVLEKSIQDTGLAPGSRRVSKFKASRLKK